MKIDGKAYRTIWVADDGAAVEIIDQQQLPHVFATVRLETLPQAAEAIRAMTVRGAPPALIFRKYRCTDCEYRHFCGDIV